MRRKFFYFVVHAKPPLSILHIVLVEAVNLQSIQAPPPLSLACFYALALYSFPSIHKALSQA